MAPSATIDTSLLASDGKLWDGPLKINFVSKAAYGPLCWDGPILSRDDYVVTLTEHAIRELEEATAAYAGVHH
jgi:hypothetical protein